MKDMKVSAKLIFSFIITIVFSAVIGMAGLVGLGQMDQAAEEMYEDQTQPLLYLAKALEEVQRIRVGIGNAIIYTGDERLGNSKANTLKRCDDFEASTAAYKLTLKDELSHELLDKALAAYTKDFKPGVIEILSGAEAGLSQEDLLVIQNRIRPSVDVVVANLTECLNIKVDDASALNDDTTALHRMLRIIIISVLVVSVLISIFLARYVSGHISTSLTAVTGWIRQAGETGNLYYRDDEWALVDQLSQYGDEIGQVSKAYGQMMRQFAYYGEVINKVANRDLTVEVDILSENDTFGTAIKRMTDNLNTMFGDIHASAAQVTTGAKQVSDTASSIASSSAQIAGGAQSLAEGSTKQAAAVEKLSRAIIEVAGKNKTNADMTNQAAKLADIIINKTESGSRQMDDMITAVNDITEASKLVSNIMETINGIAAQTNLLSLNAAIEAARAGEYGRGFAVVAEEVRKLAAQSEEAARETSSIIQNSIQKAELGVRMADEMAVRLTEIVTSINESNRLIMEIAKASEEQSVSLSQINVNIDQVAAIVEQNSAVAQESAAAAQESAAASEESAAAADEMSSQSNILKNLIAQFNIRKGKM